MVMVLFGGFMYDIIGRKKTLFLAFFLSAITIFVMPFTAPSVSLLIVVRILFHVTIEPVLAHPLINDYIDVKSRGKAFSV